MLEHLSFTDQPSFPHHTQDFPKQVVIHASLSQSQFSETPGSRGIASVAVPAPAERPHW